MAIRQMLAVIFYLGCTGLALSLSLAGPVFVALLAGDVELAERFSIYFILGIFLFVTPVLAARDRAGQLSQMSGLVLLILVWTLLPLGAAVPIMDITDLSFIDALFESVSGITTMGGTTIINVESLPQAVLFWRIYLQWFGGLLAILTVFTVLAPMGIGGLTANAISVRGRRSTVAPRERIIALIQSVGIFYVVLTFVAFLVFFLSGMRAFHAATLAMTAVSTGGFLPIDTSLDLTLGPLGMVVFAVVLILGATSVFWHRMLLSFNASRLREHRESYSVIVLILALALLLLITLGNVSGTGITPAFASESLMNAASLVATSGVQSRPGMFTLLPLGLVLFVVLLGGSAFSTSGGLKHYRVGAMATQSMRELDRLIYPSAVSSARFGSQRYDLDLMKAIWSFFVATILVIAVGTTIIATSGVPFEASLTATIAAFSTAGPVYASGWDDGLAQAWPTFAQFSDTAKIALMVIMLLGRLEVLAILGLLNLRYWRSH